MRTFVVNLKRSEDRRERMKNVLKNFPYPWEFFEGVDGRDIKNIDEVQDKKKVLRFHKADLKLGELGCALSHITIYKKMIDENIERALILEDDIFLKKDFYEVLEKVKDFQMNNDVFMLGHSGLLIRKKAFGKKIYKNYSLKKTINSVNGTFAYMVDLNAAKKLYAFNFPLKVSADSWRLFSSFVNIYIVEPVVVDFKVEDYHSIVDEIDERWSKKENILIRLKKSKNIFVFIKTFSDEAMRLIRGVLRRIDYVVEALVFAVLPQKRI